MRLGLAQKSSQSEDYTRRFGAIERLFGRGSTERLWHAHVAVIGVGGVGSWAVEALARSGIGELTLIDLDDVCVTNVNRQLPALEGDFGRPKVDVLAERIARISPECRVSPKAKYFTEQSASELLAPQFDYVIDAVDRAATKALLVSACCARNLPILTVGGAGGKRDGTGVRIDDLAHSEKDELLRQVRRLLRREYGFPRHFAQPFGVRCVYSPERPQYPWADGTCSLQKEPGSSLSLDCASGFGTAIFTTGSFGLAAAGEVVRQIVNGASAAKAKSGRVNSA